jgi:hypothetical protein
LQVEVRSLPHAGVVDQDGRVPGQVGVFRQVCLLGPVVQAGELQVARLSGLLEDFQDFGLGALRGVDGDGRMRAALLQQGR